MKKSAPLVLGLLSALPMAFATSAAYAQQRTPEEMQPVEISGRALPAQTRFDVSKVCPDVATSLRDSLALIAYREDQTATVRVDFRLTGNKVEEVKARSVNSAYRQATRRAVNKLACADGSSAQPQQFSFLVSFISADDEVPSQSSSRVALLER